MLFPPFLFSCFAFAFLIYDVLQKTKAQKNSVHWHHAWKGDILHIYFSYIFKNICDFFFLHGLLCVFGRATPSLYARQPHKDILPSVPAETSHRNLLLQKTIPCSEQLWTILVAVSKSLQSSCSGNVLLYNRLGRDLKQEASKYFRVWFKSQAEPPHSTILGQSSLSESYLIFSLFLICLYVLAHQKKKKRLFFNSSCIQALSPR